MPTTKDDPTPKTFSAMEERRPLPDPTTLTTAQLLREIEWLRQILDHRFGAVDGKFHEYEKAVALLQDFANRSPTIAEVDGRIMSLRDLHETKFEGVQTQFKERDTRVEQAGKDNKDALAAALNSAKEIVITQNTANALANNKTEMSFTKQFDQIGAQINVIVKTVDDKFGNLNKAVDDKFGDIKDRITTIESKTAGMAMQKVESTQGIKDNVGYMVAAVSILFGLLSIAGLVVALFNR